MHLGNSGRFNVLCCAVFLVCSQAVGQLASPPDSLAADSSYATHSFFSRYNMASVASVGLVGGSLAYAAGVWWVNDFSPFHHDPSGWWDTDMGVDKEGHLFTCYYMFRGIRDMLLWGGHD